MEKDINLCTPNGTFETATNGANANRELYGENILWDNFRTGEKFYFDKRGVLQGVRPMWRSAENGIWTREQQTIIV